MDYGNLKPKLYCSLSIQDDAIIAVRGNEEFTIGPQPFEQDLTLKILNRFNGMYTIKELVNKYNIQDTDYKKLLELVDGLSEFGLLLKNQQVDFVSGIECLLEVEDLQNKLLYEILYKNIFWTKCQTPEEVPFNVFIGLAIENYHFLYRESWFDAPILSWQGSKNTRVLMNEFFVRNMVMMNLS